MFYTYIGINNLFVVCKFKKRNILLIFFKSFALLKFVLHICKII